MKSIRIHAMYPHGYWFLEVSWNLLWEIGEQFRAQKHRLIWFTHFILVGIIYGWFSQSAARIQNSILGLWLQNQPRPIFLPTFDKSYCDKRLSFSTNGISIYVKKQSVAWKVCYVVCWYEEARKHMGMRTDRLDFTESLLKTTFSPIQSLNHSLNQSINQSIV